jgi:hypothetical protein
MAVNATEAELIQLLNGIGQSVAILPVTSQAGHPRIHFELNGEASTTAIGEVLTEQGLAHAAEGRH